MRQLAALCIALLLAAPAIANDTTLNVNVDPPRQLSRYEAVPIRMVDEHITVRFGKEECQVEVEFTFVNQSDDAVYCWAGFPDEDLLKAWMFYGAPDAQGNMPDFTFGGEELWGDYAGQGPEGGVVQDFTAWTRGTLEKPEDNQPLTTQLTRIERIAYEPNAVDKLGEGWKAGENVNLNELMFCHVFPLNLEAWEGVVIGHSYTTKTGSNVESQHLFNYTLGTGRTLQGTIGKATIDVYLQDGLTAKDLQFQDDREFYGAVTSPAKAAWKSIATDHLLVVWTDFEPEGDQAYIMLATKPVPPPVE